MILGIDLGTTNSAAAVWMDGGAALIPNALGNYLTPSVVSILENGDIITGEAAKERLITHPNLTAAAFKRYMGTNREFALGGQNFRPEALSSFILRSLKSDAENFLKKEISEAIITVPAYFNDTQRKATRTAAELAGLKVDRLLNEPTAAALSYGVHLSNEDRSILVFDLGGGTFDVSILELFEGVMEVRASAGDNFLGGEDFKKALMEHILDNLLDEKIHDSEIDPVNLSKFEKESERIKVALSADNEVSVKMPFLNAQHSLSITREKFEKLSRECVERIQRPLERTIRDSGIKLNELDAIILVGGATRMPMISRFIAKFFGRFPNKDIDPDLAVAMGASIQGALKESDAALDEVVLTDICPYTLGIEITKVFDGRYHKNGRFLPIIERNTAIPTSRVDYIEPIDKKQHCIDIKIYQGESYNVDDNIYLGKLSVAFPPYCKETEKVVEVRFTYDINGILEVEAKVLSTEKIFRIIIEENPGSLSKEQIQALLEKLEKLKIHPRDQSLNKAVLCRAERLYEEMLGDTRDYIGDQITMFQTLLDSQNPEEIDNACKKFIELLDTIENGYQ
jgi:molecular chaperone HscC